MFDFFSSLSGRKVNQPATSVSTPAFSPEALPICQEGDTLRQARQSRIASQRSRHAQLRAVLFELLGELCPERLRQLADEVGGRAIVQMSVNELKRYVKHHLSDEIELVELGRRLDLAQQCAEIEMRQAETLARVRRLQFDIDHRCWETAGERSERTPIAPAAEQPESMGCSTSAPSQAGGRWGPTSDESATFTPVNQEPGLVDDLFEQARAKAKVAEDALRDLASDLCTAEMDNLFKIRPATTWTEWSADDWMSFFLGALRPKLTPPLPPERQALARHFRQLTTANRDLQQQYKALTATLELMAEQTRLMLRPQNVSHPMLASSPHSDLEADLVVDDLIMLMAATGLARWSQLHPRLALAWNIRPGELQPIVRCAVQRGLIQVRAVALNWPDAAKDWFLQLTAAGQTRADELEVPPAPSEAAIGQMQGYSLAHAYLLLEAIRLLSQEHYREIKAFPPKVYWGLDLHYQPPLVAGRPSPALDKIFVECTCDTPTSDRPERWFAAAYANRDQINLVTVSRSAQEKWISQLNQLRLKRRFRLLVCNLRDYADGRRGQDGSMWTYDSDAIDDGADPPTTAESTRSRSARRRSKAGPRKTENE